MEWGPFAIGPLSCWRLINIGSATLAGVRATGLAEPRDCETAPPPSVEREGSHVTIHFHDVASFRIDLADSLITIFDVDAETGDNVIDHLLNDQLAPRLLAEAGATVLHASAVRFGDKVAVFLGETGAGKSTLATSLHQAGFQLLGDDAVIVTRGPGGHFAQAVYPSLRLFPEVISRLIGDTAITTPMADYSDKQHVSLPTLPAEVGAPVPLAAIFFLAGDCDAADPRADALGATMACIKLIEQSFSLDPRDLRCAARRLAALSALALEVPTYTLSYPHAFDRLGEVHEIIETIITSSGAKSSDKPAGNLAQ